LLRDSKDHRNILDLTTQMEEDKKLLDSKMHEIEEEKHLEERIGRELNQGSKKNMRRWTNDIASQKLPQVKIFGHLLFVGSNCGQYDNRTCCGCCSL